MLHVLDEECNAPADLHGYLSCHRINIGNTADPVGTE